MSYQVIARKWRPQSFQELVGQTHITQTLANALKNGRIHHALLFTGPRGTGKTSSARILAKSLRCPKAENFVPCNQCPSCLEIASSRSLDVQELDAASNNGVDDIRQLLEGVMSAPAVGKYKIYIIDEVHMLSGAAFNALLKTLEEPPAHVVFIMATTEVQKIPATILSRCQRFDFKRIPTRTIAERLNLICADEKVKATEDAIWLIARQGDGSMRDSQSLLDQVITFANGELTKDVIVQILGLTDRSLLLEVISSLIKRDGQAMIHVIEKLNQSGTEPKLFAQDLLEMIRHLLIVKVSSAEATSILDVPDSEIKAYAEFCSEMSEEDLHLLFDMGIKGAADIARAQDPRVVLEVMLLRMTSAPRIQDLQSLISGAAPAPKTITSSATPKITKSPTAPIRRELRQEEPKPSPAPEVKAISKAQGATEQEKWLDFVGIVQKHDAIFAAKIENLIFSGLKEKNLQLGVPAKLNFLKEQMSHSEVRKKLASFIDSHWAAGYSFELVAGPKLSAGESAQAMVAKKQNLAEEEIRQRIEQDPVVQATKELFRTKIKAITPIKGDEQRGNS